MLIGHCAAPAPSDVPQLTVSSIGLAGIEVVVGDQPEINSGHVVNYGSDSIDGCWPGQGCTVWLAGHRTSHGAIFRNVPRLQPGDEVTLQYKGQAFTYVVTDRSFVDRLDPPPDYVRGDLMIQTSWTRGRVLLVYAQQKQS
jgi:sortase (surface protein transpeptidase)